jgi:hypothetical protein
MATTTPNYGWPVPTSTDLVKDGATAIEDLGDAIDATVFGLPSSALSLINATTFGAVSSQSFNDVFSATYDNYVILMDLDNQGAQVIRFRYRVSGADNTTSNYAYHTQLSSTGSTAYASVVANAGSSIFLTSSDGANSENSVNVTTFGPFLSARTKMLGLHNMSSASGAAPWAGGMLQTAFLATTSFTGFSIFPDSSTISGTVRVYGVEN